MRQGQGGRSRTKSAKSGTDKTVRTCCPDGTTQCSGRPDSARTGTNRIRRGGIRHMSATQQVPLPHSRSRTRQLQSERRQARRPWTACQQAKRALYTHCPYTARSGSRQAGQRHNRAIQHQRAAVGQATPRQDVTASGRQEQARQHRSRCHRKGRQRGAMVVHTPSAQTHLSYAVNGEAPTV